MKRQIEAGYQTMAGISLNMFSEYDLAAIHHDTMEVMFNTGLVVESKKARDIFKKGGAKIDEDKKLVRIPSYMVEEAIRRCPASFILHGRVPERDIVMGRNHVNFCNFGEAIMILDPDTGVYRETTYDDVCSLTAFIDAMDEIDFCFSSAVSRDKPTYMNALWCAFGEVNNTTKPYLVTSEDARTSEQLIALAEIVAGGSEQLDLRPGIVGGGCPQSPLMYSEGLCEVIIAFAERNLANSILSMAMSGGSSPVTLAGTLVTHNAEVLTGVVLAQLVKPGAPIIYGSSTTAMDLRFGSASVGSPELALLSAGVACLAQNYQIPSLVAGG
jgi:trimethylamine--corrinoid protein Co-methyltransferase